MTSGSHDPMKTVEKRVKQVLRIFGDYFKSTSEVIGEVLAEKDAYDRAWWYKNSLDKLCNNIRIFGMSKPVPLRDIFVRVNILEKINAHINIDSKTLQDWEEALRKGERRFGHVQETKVGLDVIKNNSKAIVLGKPGAGKTTFLKRIVLHALEGDLPEIKIPIFISLKEWSESKKSLFAFIVQQFDICQFSQAGPFITHMLEEGKCLLLLDGFDEVTEDVGGAIQKIKNFSTKYSNNQFVLSCRIAAWNYVFEQFTDLEMADFNDKQIHSFIRNWYGENRAKANSCWKSMREKPPIKELATNPLLLTMLCLAYNDTMDFPTNRSELYDDAVNALLSKWDASRNIQRDNGDGDRDIYKILSRKSKVDLLCEIAAKTFEKGNYFIKQRDMEKEIGEYIKNLPQANGDAIELDSRTVLKSIEAQHGLIVERAKGIYSFSHLSFHEFFTAKYIVKNEARVKRLANKDLLASQWKEVFILTAGMLENADAFLLKLRSKVSELADAKLKRYLKNAEKAVLACENVPASLCRIQSVASVKKWGTYFSDFDNLACLLSDACSASLDLNIGLDAKIVEKLHEEDISSLEPYIMATELLVECLNAECYLSREVRNHLLNGLLIEPSEFRPGTKEKKPSWNILESLKPSCDEGGENTIVIALPNLPENAKPLALAQIPAGEFMMGSPDDEKDRYDDENPCHRIVIPNDFYIGKYPITQAQWEAVMKENPSNFEGNPNHPVERVSWDDCQAFLKKINSMNSGEFRLPSEAEWEYACRAGTTTRFYWGDDPDYKDIHKYAWSTLNAPIQTHEIGLLQPNPWGIHDISGNVFEWCEDDWHDRYEGAPKDGSAWIDAPRCAPRCASRVVRGGSWNADPRYCRSAYRGHFTPDVRFNNLGFRVVQSRTP